MPRVISLLVLKMFVTAKWSYKVTIFIEFKRKRLLLSKNPQIMIGISRYQTFLVLDVEKNNASKEYFEEIA